MAPSPSKLKRVASKRTRAQGLRVRCVDDHAQIFESRASLRAATRRRAKGRETTGDRLSVSLTVGKVYVVRREDLGMYAIRDDTGGVYLFPKTHFRIVRR